MRVRYLIQQNEKDITDGDTPTCTVGIQISGKSKGYLMFIDRLLSLMVSHNVRGDLDKLKDILEGEVDPVN